MKPHMKEDEINLFISFIRHSDKYVEFGCGGSTIIASHFVKDWIISVDSSEEWINKIKEDCQREVLFHHIDIGPIANWGTPSDGTSKNKWPDYSTTLWKIENSSSADLFLIDGRFRVACFAQVCLHCAYDAIIGVHDFKSREKHYGVIKELAREIASVDDLTFFIPKLNSYSRVQEVFEQYRYDYK